MPLKFNKPRKLAEGKHKFEVLVWDPEAEKAKIVKFGDVRYEDYTQHRDPARRENYLRRSAGIRNARGLTKDDPLSANYWSRRYLWASREPDFTSVPGPSYQSATRRAES